MGNENQTDLLSEMNDSTQFCHFVLQFGEVSFI
jgi:hypothetical protein